MRIIKKGIAHRNGEGFVRLQADEPEDMYHLYNLICEGDVVRADTIRNVRNLMIWDKFVTRIKCYESGDYQATHISHLWASNSLSSRYERSRKCEESHTSFRQNK